MRKIIILCLLALMCKGFSQTNLVTTATITASSTNSSYPIANVKDGNASTKWQSSGSGTQYLNFTLLNTIRYATVNLTNVTAVNGFSIQLSADNSTWTTVASNLSSASNLYLLSNNQFLSYKYIRIKLEANQGNASVAEAVIYEGTSLISSFSSTNYSAGHEPINAVDFNSTTYFENNSNSLCLTLQLSRSIGAINASIITSVGNIAVSINGNGGNIDNYYYTVNPSENFLIVNPAGIQTVIFSKSDGARIYDVTLEEIPLSTISMPFTYDAGGNMITRTILFSTSKAALEEIRDTIIPADPEFGNNKPYTDEFAGKKIFVYPIPTKGLITIDFKNLFETDRIEVQLYSVTGQKMLEKSITENTTSIDLQNKPNGTYILNIKINSETHKWTIIKE